MMEILEWDVRRAFRMNAAIAHVERMATGKYASANRF
jgi:hypothetical protein